MSYWFVHCLYSATVCHRQLAGASSLAVCSHESTCVWNCSSDGLCPTETTVVPRRSRSAEYTISLFAATVDSQSRGNSHSPSRPLLHSLEAEVERARGLVQEGQARAAGEQPRHAKTLLLAWNPAPSV